MTLAGEIRSDGVLFASRVTNLQSKVANSDSESVFTFPALSLLEHTLFVILQPLSVRGMRINLNPVFEDQ